MADFRVKPVETDEELRQANGLMAEAYAAHDPRLRHWLWELAHRYPGYRREHTRILRGKGEVVSALRIVTDTISIGESRLKMGGIGWVATAPHHRGKGHCRALMFDAMDFMKRNNYHVSMLFGYPDFGRFFGYAPAFADYAIYVDLNVGKAFEPLLRMRPARPGEIPAIQKLHHACSTDVACGVLRTAAHFRNRWDCWHDWFALTDAQGRLDAYFIASLEGGYLRVDDAACAHPGLCPALIGATAELAAEHAARGIVFYIPPSHVLARCLLRFPSRHETRIVNEGGMMRFINLGETLESLIPEWESLLGRSLARELHTEFTLFVSGQPFRIRNHHGAVDVSSVAGANKLSLDMDEMMFLAAGFIYPEDILAAHRCIMSSDARSLFLALFPKRNPYVWPFDRFEYLDLRRGIGTLMQTLGV